MAAKDTAGLTQSQSSNAYLLSYIRFYIDSVLLHDFVPSAAASPIFKMCLSFETKLANSLHHRRHLVECSIHRVTCAYLNSRNTCGQVDFYPVNTAHRLRTGKQSDLWCTGAHL